LSSNLRSLPNQKIDILSFISCYILTRMCVADHSESLSSMPVKINPWNG
jgi:hypothetical protein